MTPELIGAIGTGIVAIIGAIFGGLLMMQNARMAAKVKQVEETVNDPEKGVIASHVLVNNLHDEALARELKAVNALETADATIAALHAERLADAKAAPADQTN